MELYLGTGGYSNDDWLGLLYPQGTKSGDYLKIYAQHFNAVELNSSFYAIPGIRAFQGMVKKSDAKVRFAVKVHQSMTHTRDADEAMVQLLFESVQPLREVGMLGPFLAQFPYSFHRTPENRLYLKNLVECFKEANETLAVEFRNAAWHVPEVVQAFEETGLVLVSVDYPQVGGMPKPELYLTSDIVYLRLHGRNEEKWYGGKDASERHDYLYTPNELKPWVLGLAERRDEIHEAYVLFQNTTKGHALKNLEMLKALCDEVGLDAPIAP
jgi:uncharacterized protein YecE (DUF72 family)